MEAHNIIPAKRRLLSRSSVLYLLMLGISSCSVGTIRKVDNTSERFYRKGFSILAPQESGWQVKDGYRQKVSFFKKDAAARSSYVVLAYSVDHPLSFESEKEYEMLMGKLRLAMEFRPKQNVFLEKKVSLAPDIGKFCLKSYSKMKDFGKKGKGSDSYMLMENFGMICLHPDDKNQLVNFALTYRYPPGAKDQDIKAQAERILAGLKMEPLQEKPLR